MPKQRILKPCSLLANKIHLVLPPEILYLISTSWLGKLLKCYLLKQKVNLMLVLHLFQYKCGTSPT